MFIVIVEPPTHKKGIKRTTAQQKTGQITGGKLAVELIFDKCALLAFSEILNE